MHLKSYMEDIKIKKLLSEELIDKFQLSNQEKVQNKNSSQSFKESKILKLKMDEIQESLLLKWVRMDMIEEQK